MLSGRTELSPAETKQKGKSNVSVCGFGSRHVALCQLWAEAPIDFGTGLTPSQLPLGSGGVPVKKTFFSLNEARRCDIHSSRTRTEIHSDQVLCNVIE